VQLFYYLYKATSEQSTHAAPFQMPLDRSLCIFFCVAPDKLDNTSVFSNVIASQIHLFLFAEV